MASNIHIFILEDEQLIRESLIDSLQELGYHSIAAAKNAIEAKEAFKTLDFDIALLDIGIRDSNEDGIEIASYINKSYPKTQIIFTSSYSDHQTLLRSEKILHSNYLVKPVSDRQLFVAIEKALKMPPESNGEPLNDRIFVKGKDKFYEKVMYKDIMWIKGESTGTRIKTTYSEIYTYNILANILESISDPAIIRIHKSHAVNLHNVRGISDNEIELEDGKLLTIGRTYSKDVHKSFNKLKPKAKS